VTGRIDHVDALTNPTNPASARAPDDRRPLVRRLAAPLCAIASVGAAFAYVGAVDPNQPGHYPVCPLLRLTGIYCPGCGGLRSAHAVAHGELGITLGANALAVLAYIAFVVFCAVWLGRAIRGRRYEIAVRPVHWWALGALALTFVVARNLPFGAVFAP
jgi:hypothetical protein